MNHQILHGDALTMLKTLPACSVQCVVTSPPYWALRDYGVEGQLGLEPTPEQYIENMVAVFREVKRVRWKPSCKCDPLTDGINHSINGGYQPVPCTVLDPFHSAGTTMKVCERLGLSYVGVELNQDYIDLSLQRPSVHFPHERKRAQKRNKINVRQPMLFDTDLPMSGGNHPIEVAKMACQTCQNDGSLSGGGAYGA